MTGFNYLAHPLPRFAQVLRTASWRLAVVWDCCCGFFILKCAAQLVGSEEAQALGVVAEVGVEPVDEGLAFAAVYGLEILEAHQFVEAGSESFVRPAEKLPELAAGPGDSRYLSTMLLHNLPGAFPTGVDEFPGPSAEFVQGNPEDSERQPVRDGVIFYGGLDVLDLFAMEVGRFDDPLKLVEKGHGFDETQEPFVVSPGAKIAGREGELFGVRDDHAHLF